MRLLFCASPLDPRQVDPDWSAEARAAREADWKVELIDFEALAAGEVTSAIRRVAASEEPAEALYRGWMLSPERYGVLFEALATRKNLRLVNDPAQYRTCHHLPGFYPLIEGRTPRSCWIARDDFSPDHLEPALAMLGDALGSGPAIVKDFAKSQKHYWAEACFIPDASDRPAAERVIRRFLELQGDDLAGGLVFREFLDLDIAGVHPQSGMPLAREFRIFYCAGRPLDAQVYWGADVADPGAPPPADEFAALARAIPSRFFALDAARLKDGRWVVVEIGDGQVSGLPEGTDAAAFYASLRAMLSL
jgi:hypothetical protein